MGLELREIQARDVWNGLVLELPDCDLRQAYEWGEVRGRQGWIPRRLAVFEGDICAAAVSLLVRRIPLLGCSIMAAPGGPLLRRRAHDSALTELFQGIRRVGAEERAILLRAVPQVPNDDVMLRGILITHGFSHLPDDWTVWNIPRIVMTADISKPLDVLWRNVRKRFREYIASAANRGVTVRTAASLEDVLQFQAALALVGRRKGLPVRHHAYFQSLWKEYLRPGRGVLLLADREGETIGGLLGVRFGPRAYMLYVTTREQERGAKPHQGPLLYWEFIHWAKKAGCQEIDWGGVGTNFPPREQDPGFGLYSFKLGFDSSLRYFSGYYDFVFRPSTYRVLRFIERRVAATAWDVRARLNQRFDRMRALARVFHRKIRQFCLGASTVGIRSTLYWAVFGYLRPNLFVVLRRDLSAAQCGWAPRDDATFEIWEASAIRAWRRSHPALSTEFLQDEIDGVGTCGVVMTRGDLAGLIWLYDPEDASRLFSLREAEVELNNGYILPKHRGRGLFKDLIAFSCSRLSATGYRTAFAMVHASNGPSLRAFRGAGFQNAGSVRHFLLARPKFDPT